MDWQGTTYEKAKAMRKLINHDPTDWALLQNIPFAGLGFDLACVARRAALLACKPVRTLSFPVERIAVDVPVYGYALQLVLGREVRAG